MISTTHAACNFGRLLLLLAAPVFASYAQQLPPASLVAATPDIPPSKPDVLSKSSQATLIKELDLARNYLTGNGVPRDPSQSAYWYRKAADSGNPSAQVELGYFYLAGLGVTRDAQQAAQWFERAAGSGSATAKLNLAVLYIKGTGVPRDPHLGFSLMTELAKAGDPRGEAYLGLLYFMGIGAQKDPAAAEEWFKKGAKHHNPEAEYDMGTLYANIPTHAHDLSKAADYFRSSAKAGYVLSMHSLGLLLLLHPEVPQQADEWSEWMNAASAAGSWRSSAVLGVVARDGKRGTADRAAAYRWFTIAAMQGGSESETYLQSDLVQCRGALSPEQRSQAEQAAADWIAAHPRRDVYTFKPGQENSYFPLVEVYAIELAQAGSIEGANIH
jgi:TPR repeat protein